MQDMLYVPADFAAYEHGTRYCPDCDFEFPEPSSSFSTGYGYEYAEGGEHNETYGEMGYVDKSGGVGMGMDLGMTKDIETVYVSVYK